MSFERRRGGTDGPNGPEGPVDQPDRLPHRTDAAAFDLDDFLVNSQAALKRVHVDQALEAGKEPPSDELLDEIVGGPSEGVMGRLWGELSPEEQAAKREDFRARVNADPNPASPIEGVREGLERLHDARVPVWVVTNRGAGVERAIASGGLSTTLFKGILTPHNNKDKAVNIGTVRQEEGMLSGHHLLVGGDSPSDMDAARRADPNIMRVAVPSKGKTLEALREKGAQIIVPSFSEVVRLVFESRQGGRRGPGRRG